MPSLDQRITNSQLSCAATCLRKHAIAYLYGITLYLLGGLSLVVAVVPSNPSIGVASILALSVAFMAAIKTWRAWWRRQFHVDPTPYEQSVRRTMKGASL